MKKHVSSLLSNGITVVMDFPANTKNQRNWFLDIIEETKVEHILHFVDKSDEVCKKQLRQRSEKLPTGIPHIIGNEAAERFSFYGMKAILAVFLTKYLMDSSGNTDFMTEDQATSWIHYFTFAVYMTPLVGAIFADWLFGKYVTFFRTACFAIKSVNFRRDFSALGMIFDE